MSLNLADCIALSAQRSPDNPAVLMDETTMSYAEVAGAAQRVANILAAKGIGYGDRVAMILPNTPHFPIVYFGILYTGATVVALNPLASEHELSHILADTEAKALFLWKDCLKNIGNAFEKTATCEHLVVVEPKLKPEQPEQGESFVMLMAGAAPEYDMYPTMPEDIAVILYTAATDGKAKGAQLTHFNLFQNAQTIVDHVLHLDETDVCMAVLPLFHGFGQSSMMNACFMAGGTSALFPRFDAAKVFSCIEQHKVTQIAVVPTMVHFMLHFKHDTQFDMSSIKTFVVGGAAMGHDLPDRMKERFGIDIVEGYGLTETSPVVSCNLLPDQNKLGSVGKPLWGCQVAIRNEDMSFSPPNVEGEVVIRGHNVMTGYLNDPEGTAEVMHGGWFHTGDLGYVDEDGFLFLTGRKKDLIIRAGLNIYPRELEMVLSEHPQIDEVAVVGIPDELRGEEVRAFYVSNGGDVPPEKELQAWCRTHLAVYKCPRHFVHCDSLPRNAQDEIDKNLLRQAEH